ncbi:septum formation initiator family protein [Rhodobacteraceae bacterium NNCM2]|nr:septum formation initiator family protein [Coraliihabitans acroporae]
MDWGQIVTPGLSILIFAGLIVFGHSALYGQHGLSALRDAEQREVQMHAQLEDMRAERRRLANLVSRLGSENLDLDLLDERARRVLGYTRADEIIIE